MPCSALERRGFARRARSRRRRAARCTRHRDAVVLRLRGSGSSVMRSRTLTASTCRVRVMTDLRVFEFVPKWGYRAMDAFDIPRLRGVTHAYAFWVALVAVALPDPADPRRAPRVAAAIYGVGLCALFGGCGLYTAGAGIRAGGRCCGASTTPRSSCSSPRPTRRSAAGALRHDALGRPDHGLGGRAGRRDAQRRLDQRAARLCAACYVALGWVAVLAFPQMQAELPRIALVLMGAGGVLYTIGALIFALGARTRGRRSSASTRSSTSS